MSLDAQDWVWEHSRSKGTARLVILAIADLASGPSCSAYAGTTLLMKRANASRRAVVMAVDSLIADGEVEVVEGRWGPHGETRYRLPKAAGHRRGGADSAPVQNLHRGGADFAPGGVQNLHGGGAKSAPGGVQNLHPITQLNAGNAERTQLTHGDAQTRETHTDALSETPGVPADDSLFPAPQADKPKRRRAAETPIPADFGITPAMRADAKAKGYTVDLDRETYRFINHANAKGRRCRDWVAAWRNWIDKAQEFADRDAQRAPARPTSGPMATSDTYTEEDIWK